MKAKRKRVQESSSSSSRDEDLERVVKKAKISKINGFSLFPVALGDSCFLKNYYLKEHKDKEINNDSILFVNNLAYDVTQKDLESVFGEYGQLLTVKLQSFKEVYKIEKKVPIKMGVPTPSQQILLEEKKKKDQNIKNMLEKYQAFESAGYAHVFFVDDKNVSKALSGTPTKITKEKGTVKGLEKWKKQYNSEYKIDAKEVKREVDLYMWKFDKSKLALEKKMEGLSKEDNDGWITVTSKSTKKKGEKGFEVADKLDVETIAKIQEKEKNKRKADFYRFQTSKKKQNHLEELRKKFEQDKKRIEAMRQSRKFKPF